MATLEKRVRVKAEKALAERRGLRNLRTEDIFTRRYLIGPGDLYVENYPRRRPLSAFNPGAALLGDKVLIFPRLIFDYYSYTSSIGVSELPLKALLSGEFREPLKVKIVVWPQTVWEAVKGCEDPRVFRNEDGFLILYTAVGKFEKNGKKRHGPALALAELGNGFQVKRKGFFSIVGPEKALIVGNKDSALIKVQGEWATMLTRPSFSLDVPKRIELFLHPLGFEPPNRRIPEMCWRATANLDSLTIPEESMEPVLVPEAWEEKVGWSTNTVKLSNNEYLIGWHGVLREDTSYRNGLALVDEDGRLISISDYLLAPKGLQEEYGDRSLTIFGDGLLCDGDHLIWIGGVSDYAIGVFIAKLEDALSKLREV